MNKLNARVFQNVIKLGIRHMPLKMPEVIEGDGCVVKLPSAIKARGHKKVLIVTGSKVSRAALFSDMLKAMENIGLDYVIYDGIHPNPTDTEVFDGLRIFEGNGCEALVAFGGGSPMDCCKGIAAVSTRKGKTIRQLSGLLKVGKGAPEIFAVPTTAGTGSETTIAAVITDEATSQKVSISDPRLIPKIAVLDSLLTETMSPELTAATGMDALTHAVEAYTNQTYNTKTENQAAEDAVFLIYHYLYRAYTDGHDKEARRAMQKAAFYAGRAFTRGCVGYVHAVGHTLSGLYGLSHGLAMAVILPHVIRKFGPAVHERLARLSEVCGMEANSCGESRTEKANSDAEKAEKFISWIESMNNKMGIPSGFSVIKDEDIPQIIRWAEEEANPLYPTPVFWNSEDFRKLVERIRRL